jgi:hypothetical protein
LSRGLLLRAKPLNSGFSRRIPGWGSFIGVSLAEECDQDDTVMVTALPRPSLANWNSCVRDKPSNALMPDIAVLLKRFVEDNFGATVTYLSTGQGTTIPTVNRLLCRPSL